jgi:glycosyltransferase involved in cell wall biosynthesis
VKVESHRTYIPSRRCEKKVLIYKAHLLYQSETFIREQVFSYADWSVVLVGKRFVPGLALDGLQTRLLEPEGRGAGQGLCARALRYLGLANPSFVRTLRQEGATLVHAHFGPEGVEIWPVARRLELPLIVTVHGFDVTIRKSFWEEGHAGSFMAAYPRRLAAMAQSPRVHFVAVSNAIRDAAIGYGIPEERVSVKYVGINVSVFEPAGIPVRDRRPRVLFVGRLVEKKGVAFLIEAFARVKVRVPNAELVIVGDGPLRVSLAALAAELAVPVTFAGAMDRQEIKRQMDDARVFCLPSVTAQNGDAEGLGIVLLEAQACGVPVVTSARGGATEAIIHGQTGLAFEEKDVDMLSQHLITLLVDDECASRMSASARRFVKEKFDLHRCTQSLEALYEQMVAR